MRAISPQTEILPSLVCLTIAIAVGNPVSPIAGFGYLKHYNDPAAGHSILLKPACHSVVSGCSILNAIFCT